MFVKQIDLQEALRMAANGHEVKVMAPSTPEPEKWTDYEPDMLQHMLGGCLFFRSEPAEDNPDLAAAVQDMTNPPPALMEILRNLPEAPPNRPASVWVPVPSGNR